MKYELFCAIYMIYLLINQELYVTAVLRMEIILSESKQ